MAKTIRSPGHEALREALIAARKDAGLTQAGLAARLMCHQSFVARVESGQRRIDVVELIVISRAIGSPPNDVLALVEAATGVDHKV